MFIANPVMISISDWVLLIVPMNFNLGDVPSAPPKLKFIAGLSNASDCTNR